ncbi:MAG: hypothetical protein ACI8RD_002248 [Bacillariaceae sp.]|jgi:hypothetical protein
MNVSRSDFDRNAKALVSALLTTLSNNNGCETTRYHKLRQFDLCHWELHYDNNQNNLIYLSHPPVVFCTNLLLSIEDAQEEASEDIFLATKESDDDNLEDEAILDDDQCFVATILEENKNEIEDQKRQFDTQWTFSIIYSSTFRVPMLYFSVQEMNMNGSPVGRQQVLEILRQEHNKRSSFAIIDDIPTDTWEFISQEEHPITGLVSYFLHPCQSAERLHLLTAGKSDQKELCIRPEQNLTANESTSNNILWTWMSMIFPVVGHSIPASYFLKIQNNMALLEKSRKSR